MYNEANAILSHRECQLVIRDAWRGAHIQARTELKLPSGVVADVFGFAYPNDFYIAEVKHALKDSLLEQAWIKYARWCNYLYLAVAGIVEADLDRRVPVCGFPQPWHRIGIIGVYPSTFRILRVPSYHQVGRFDAADLARLAQVPVGG